MLRVLVIDDDRELCQLVSVCLVREGMSVQVSHDGRSGLKLALSGQHDLAILDVMLPQLTGLQVLKQLRSSSPIGVLMLTAHGEEVDRIIGLEYGADDYLSKPFSARELVARIRALARRLKPWRDGEMGRAPELLEIDDLILDEGARTCRRDGEIIELTTAEFDLLSLFLRCSGRTVHRKELSKQVLDRDWSPFDRSIDVHVSKVGLSSRRDGADSRHSQYWLYLRARRRGSVHRGLTLMPKLFWKIFLWFWGAMLIVNCAILFSILSIRSVSEQNRFKQFAQSMMSLQARKAAEIFESQYPKALSDYFRDFGQTDTHFSLYRSDGSDVLGTPTDETTRLWISEASQDEKTHFPRRHGPPLMLQATTGPSGAKYILSSEHASLPFAHFMRGGVLTQALRLFAVALAVALVCLVLAHYIASPILHVQSVSRRIANGDLSARVRPRLTSRRDEIADLSKDFNLMAEQIEKLLRSQSQLLQAISHEMRSPLARLTLAVGLARAASAPESDGLFERIETEAERIEQMLSQLLTLARLDCGATSFPKTPVELSLLLSDIVSDASFEGSVAKRSVILTHADPCLVDGSEALLRSAIENVIRNAVRYTRVSSTVEVSLTLDDTLGQDFAVIHVTDEGPGVPSAELSEIFKPFYRVSSARERDTGGTGLGLAITDRAVHLYHGSVAARNRTEGGLEVEIRLPVFPILPHQLPPTDGVLINA